MIIFCVSRGDVDRLAQRLQHAHADNLITACHSGLADDGRSAAHTAFSAGPARVMVASSVYGTGVSVDNVQMVLHAGRPLSMLDYVQQVGRSGERCVCTLIYADDDAAWTSLIGEKYAAEASRADEYIATILPHLSGAL